MAAVSGASRSGGAIDKGACLLVRMLGRLQLAGGWRGVLTLEVHPEFSEAPDLRSSLPHPKKELSKN